MALVLSGVALAGLMTAASAFLGARIATKPPRETPVQLIPERLTGSRTTRGVGGLRQLIVLPQGLAPGSCPIGTGRNQTCLTME